MARLDATAGRIAALDGLRGVAALVVLIHHGLMVLPDFARFQFTARAAPPHGVLERMLFDSPLRLLWAGPEAVVLFFVLSGFVLSLPWLDDRPPTARRFLVMRVCRVYLPYLAAMLLAWAAAATLGGYRLQGASVWLDAYGWATHASAGTLASVVLILGNRTSDWIDNPSWSLVWEMRVSLLFPLLVAPIAQRGLRGLVIVLAGLGVAWAGLHAVMQTAPDLSDLLHRPEETFAYAAYFVLGIVIASVRAPLGRLAGGRAGRIAVGCLVVGLLACWIEPPRRGMPLVTVGAALVVVAALLPGPVARWLSRPAARWLGRVSYSLYLVHVPIILAGQYLLHDMLPPAVIVALCLPLSLLAAEGFHRAIERPSMDLGKRLGLRRPVNPHPRTANAV